MQVQHAGNGRRIRLGRRSEILRCRWTTVLAFEGPVAGDAGLAGEEPGSGEVVRDSGAGAEIHLVRRLPAKRRMRHDGVVLLDVEANEPFHGGESIELVQVEPVMFERSPPGFDHGVRKGDLDLGEETAEPAESEEGVHLAIDILDTRVGEDGGRCAVRGKVGGRFEEHVASGLWFEAKGGLPGEDSAGVVVYDCVQVDARAIEEPEDGDIDVPVFVGPCRPQSQGRLLGVDAAAGPEPAALADESVPGGGRREDLAEALGEEGDAAHGEVAVGVVGDHLVHGPDLGSGELSRGGLGAAVAIVKEAVRLKPTPGLVAGGGKAEDAEGDGQRHASGGPADGVENLELGGAGGEAIYHEASAAEADEQEEKPQEGEEEVDAALELEHLGLEFLVIAVEELGGDDGARTSAEPACGGGARDAEAREEVGVALLAGQVAKAVVVGAAGGFGLEVHGRSPERMRRSEAE